MCKKKAKNPVYFKHRDTKGIMFREYPQFDINSMYARVFEELMEQQKKRDQLMTIYLAAFAFLVPALLSAEAVDWVFKGYIFMGLGLIGFLFALIIIRYRKYKEVYWICCRTLNVMMSLDESKWTKENIQRIFYSCLHKKIKKYIKNGKFLTVNFVFKNFFSGETLYLVINSLIAGAVFGLGLGIVLPPAINFKILWGVIVGLAVALLAVYIYFKTLKGVYKVCIDGLESSFNAAFGDAWFLHFFI